MGLDTDYAKAFAKSQLGAGVKVPTSGTAFVSVRDEDKDAVIPVARGLIENGFRIIATGGTLAALEQAGIAATKVNKVLEGRPHIVDAIKNDEVALVVNTTGGAKTIADSLNVRRAALLHKVPYYTTLAGASAAVQGIRAVAGGTLDVRPLQDYVADYVADR